MSLGWGVAFRFQKPPFSLDFLGCSLRWELSAPASSGRCPVCHLHSLPLWTLPLWKHKPLINSFLSVVALVMDCITAIEALTKTA